MNRQQRSVKRLNQSTAMSVSQPFSNLSSISENVSASEAADEMQQQQRVIVRDKKQPKTHQQQQQQVGGASSPIGKHLTLSTELKCTTESIDF